MKTFSDPEIGAELNELEDVGPTDDPLDLPIFQDRNLVNVLRRQLSQNLVPVITGRRCGEILSGGHDLAHQG